MAAYFCFENKKIIQANVGFSLRYTDAKCISVQCDNDELIRAKEIIGRTAPCPRQVHVFVGDQAGEILANWY
jgi:hypothetical protein